TRSSPTHASSTRRGTFTWRRAARRSTQVAWYRARSRRWTSMAVPDHRVPHLTLVLSRQSEPRFGRTCPNRSLETPEDRPDWPSGCLRRQVLRVGFQFLAQFLEVRALPQRVEVRVLLHVNGVVVAGDGLPQQVHRLAPQVFGLFLALLLGERVVFRGE